MAFIVTVLEVNDTISLRCSQRNFSIYRFNETANFLQYFLQIKDDIGILPQMLAQKPIALKFHKLVDVGVNILELPSNMLI